jgi:hypothetical protein
MANIESSTSVEETPVDDVEMDEGATEGAAGGDAEEEAGLTQLEPDTPKLVLFAE